MRANIKCSGSLWRGFLCWRSGKHKKAWEQAVRLTRIVYARHGRELIERKSPEGESPTNGVIISKLIVSDQRMAPVTTVKPRAFMERRESIEDGDIMHEYASD